MALIGSIIIHNHKIKFYFHTEPRWNWPVCYEALVGSPIFPMALVVRPSREPGRPNDFRRMRWTLASAAHQIWRRASDYHRSRAMPGDLLWPRLRGKQRKVRILLDIQVSTGQNKEWVGERRQYNIDGRVVFSELIMWWSYSNTCRWNPSRNRNRFVYLAITQQYDSAFREAFTTHS